MVGADRTDHTDHPAAMVQGKNRTQRGKGCCDAPGSARFERFALAKSVWMQRIDR